MIFNVPGHIEMIRNGLSNKHHSHVPQVGPTFPVKIIPEEVVKTQTRRHSRGKYEIGKDYAVQRKRGVKAEPDIRIVMDRIWIERYAAYLPGYISKEDALAEGGYKSPVDFEKAFRKLYPQCYGERWVFEFHVIEVRR